MISAFGVDHGDISKSLARGPGGLPRSRTLFSLGRVSRKGSEGAKRVGHKIANTEISVKSVGRGTGLGIEAAGRGTGKIGQALASNPSATGTVAVGGGAGYGAYRYQQAKASEPKKKPRRTPEAMA